MKGLKNRWRSNWGRFCFWGLLSLLLTACEPWNLERIDHLQVITLPELAAPEVDAARVGGSVTGIEVGTVSRHGFLWSRRNFEFELEDVDEVEVFLTDLGKKGVNGEFTKTLAPLDSNTTYFYRAFVAQGEVVCYGAVESFRTVPIQLTVKMLAVSDLEESGALLAGALEGLPTSFAVEDHGFVWANDTLSLNVESGNVLSLGRALSNGTFSDRLETTIPADETFYIQSYFKRGEYCYSCSRIALTRREGWQEAPTGSTALPEVEGSVAFTINDAAYFGTGLVIGERREESLTRLFWKLQQGPDDSPVIEPVTDFGDAPVAFGVGFSLEGRGYVGTGLAEEETLVDDFWRFDTTGSGRWTPVTVGGEAPTPRMGAVAFVIGDKAYVGLGQTAEGAQKDFYTFSPTTGWEKLPGVFPGPARSNAVAFVIDGKAYVGAGITEDFLRLRDFYEFDPTRSASSQWQVIPMLPGDARDGAVAFSLGGKGYVGLGSSLFGALKGDFWTYHPGKQEWKTLQGFGGTARRYPIAFSFQDAGWVGLGGNFFEPVPSSFWTWPADEIQQQEISSDKCPQ